MKEVAEKIKKAWKGVFNETPEVTIEDDVLTVNTYLSLHKEKIDVERKSLLGTENKNVDGWISTVWIDIPATYHEPPDVQDRELGAFERLSDAIASIIQEEVNNRMGMVFEEISMREMYNEMEEQNE